MASVPSPSSAAAVAAAAASLDPRREFRCQVDANVGMSSFFFFGVGYGWLAAGRVLDEEHG